MSLINKMLQELDRRNALGADADPVPQHVKPVVVTRVVGHEWFWRVMAVLVVIALAWVGWVAYQLQPRSVLTEQGLRAAETRGPGMPASEPAVAVTPVSAPVPVEPVPQPDPAPATPPAPAAPVEQLAKAPADPAETFKLARSIETPIAEPKAKPAEAKAKPAPKTVETPKLAAEPAMKSVVDKRERTKPVNEKAEAHFRRAALLLNQGRVSEAEEHLVGALHVDPAHLAARQAYVALLIEQRRIDAAFPVLREAVSRHPAQPAFVLALARLHAERRDYARSLEVMEKSGAAAHGADFYALRGAVLQRLGRHAEAASAYQAALESAPNSGAAWAGLGISLEALGRAAEAARAYHRAVGSGDLAKELRDYADARIRALE